MRQRQKVQAELEEAQNSLNWLRIPDTVAAYAAKHPQNPEMHVQHTTAAEKVVAKLLEQLNN